MTSLGGGDNDGMNLLGNPYPSSIDWDVLDGTYGTVYYWDSENGHYDTWSGTGSTNGGQQYLPPMQGFFVYTNAAEDFTINNNSRTHTNASSFYKSGGESIVNGLRLEATNNNGLTDDMLLLFNNNSQEGFELQTDAWKLLSGTQGRSEIYSIVNEEKLAIDVRPETEVVQLGFKNNENGIYSIGIIEIVDISEATLEDTKTNTFHNLQNETYEFAWNVTDDEKRFKLHLDAVGIEETPASESSIFVYAADDQIFIKGAEKGQVIVSDMMGRVVLEQDISGSGLVTIPVNLKTGVYVVMVLSGENIVTEKVFIK